MNPKDWKQLKEDLQRRGFTVEIKGREKKEYIVSHPGITLDILRGGIGHAGSTIEVFVYGDNLDEIVMHTFERSYTDVIKIVDQLLSDLEEFGSIS